MESGALMPAALMIGAMGTAALALCNLSCQKIPDYRLDLTPHSQEDLDIILAEQVHSPGAHAPGKDVRDLMPGKKYRQLARLVSGTFENFP